MSSPLPTDYVNGFTPLGALTELPATGPRGLNTINARINANTTSFAINVKMPPYNAVGDGVANDTTAIAAALAAAQAANRPLYFPAGTYLTSDIVDGSNIDWIGDGVYTVIKARSGSTTLLTLTDGPHGTAAAKRMSGFILDAAGIANTCLNSSWPTVGPSLRHDFRDIYMRGYLTIGWIGDNNNDCEFSHITVENNSSTPDTSIAGRFHASGGGIAFNNCVFALPIQLSCQTGTIRDGYNFGIVLDGASWNSISKHNGYLYANPVTHNNLDVATGIEVAGISLFGTHIENSYNDGCILGGVGQIDNVNAVGGHIFGVSGTTPAPKIAANTLSSSGLFGVVSLEGVFVENLNLADATKVRVFTRNVNYQGGYLPSKSGYVNADGGIMVSVGETGLGYQRGTVVTKPIFTGEIDVSAAGTTITGLPRSGIIVAKDDTAGDGCTLIAAYCRIGSLAGTVTPLHSAAGTGGITLTLAIGSGLAQDQFTTSGTLTLSSGSNKIIAYNVLGF